MFSLNYVFQLFSAEVILQGYIFSSEIDQLFHCNYDIALNRHFLPFLFRLHCKDKEQQMLRVSISVRRRKILHLHIKLVYFWKEVVCNDLQL